MASELFYTGKLALIESGISQAGVAARSIARVLVRSSPTLSRCRPVYGAPRRQARAHITALCSIPKGQATEQQHRLIPDHRRPSQRHADVHKRQPPVRILICRVARDVVWRECKACLVSYERAKEPNDLARFFIERANAGDLDGLGVLFEPDALVAAASGLDIAGHEAIRAKYAAVLARAPRFSLGHQQRAMINGDIALTSTWFDDGGAAAEVARRQPDGTWLWMIDKGQIAG